MFVYLNGHYEDAATAMIPIWDGGFLYGDGIYTTLRSYRGIPVDLTAHFERLTEQADMLELMLPFTESGLTDIIEALATRNELLQTDGRIRITLSRTGDMDNPLPLVDLSDCPVTTLVTMVPVAKELGRRQETGVPVITLGSEFSRSSTPELKTLNALPSVRALRQAARAGCFDAIVSDAEGTLLEGAVSNVFLVVDNRLLTPALDCGLLAGRTRARVLEIANKIGMETREDKLSVDLLRRAQEIFLAGSVREVMPVVSLNDRQVGDGKPGPVTCRLQAQYHADIEAERQAWLDKKK